MTNQSDEMPWVQAIKDGKTAIRRFVRAGNQPLAKYFGSSILWHAGNSEMGRLQDKVIEELAIDLAKKAISTDYFALSEDEATQLEEKIPSAAQGAYIAEAIDFMNARSVLQDVILDQFEFSSMGGNRPSSYWDFDKKEFDATKEMFEAKLKDDITRFIEGVRQHCRDGGMGAKLG